jgi:glutathione peroxidase
MAILAACTSSAERPPFTTKPIDTMSFYQIALTDLEGRPFDLTSLKGRYVLIVNTASECGFTPQYADLQKLQETYGDKLTVLGFPCNQFGGQEPGSAGEIKSFCSSKYGVSFPMFSKCDVKGKEKAPLFRWLTDKTMNGWNEQEPSWNFCKYLVSGDGELLGFYPSSVNPLDDKITSKLK